MPYKTIDSWDVEPAENDWQKATVYFNDETDVSFFFLITDESNGDFDLIVGETKTAHSVKGKEEWPKIIRAIIIYVVKTIIDLVSGDDDLP